MGELSAVDGRVSGQVEAVEYGADATHLLVFTGTGDRAQVLLIPCSDARVTVTPQASNDPGSRRARVAVDELPILPDHVIAVGDAADQLMSDARSWLRLMIAAELCGAAAQTADTAVEYVKTRHQFGQPLAAFQAVKHLAADNVQRLHLATQLCRATAVSAGRGDEQNFSVAAAMAKSLAARNSRAVSEDCLQMLGGIGFTEEHDFHWYYKRILALHWMYGGPDELASAVARQKIQQARVRIDQAV